MSELAERQIIGVLLTSKEQGDLKDVYSRLTPDMFSNELYGRIYYEFYNANHNQKELELSGLLQNLTDVAYPQDIVNEVVQECIVNAPLIAQMDNYIEVVDKDYRVTKTNDILSRLDINAANIDNQLNKLIKELEMLTVSNTQDNGITLAELSQKMKDNYFVDDEEESNIKLGLNLIDDAIVKLEGGDIIIIGARPSVGKSAFTIQIVTNLAKQGLKVGFFNLEMQENLIYERFVVAESGIGLTRLRKAKKFLGDEQERFDKANEKLSKRDNIYIYTGRFGTSDIRHYTEKENFDVVVIDYLQLVAPNKYYMGNRLQELTNISSELKALAMEKNIPIIELVQLNREVDNRPSKEPVMSDIRECGNIEQDASVIMLLWNKDEDDDTKKGFKIDKSRQGKKIKTELFFNGDIMRFEEIEDEFGYKKDVDNESPF